MFEKLVVDTSRLIKQDGEAVGLKVMQKIKNDFVRAPKADVFIYNPLKKNYRQKLAELKKGIKTFEGKEEILKHTNKNNIDAIINLSKLKLPGCDVCLCKLELREIVPILNEHNQDILVKFANLKASQEDFIYHFELEKLSSIITRKNKADIIKTLEAKTPEGRYLYGNNYIEVLQLKEAISHKTKDISDPKILDYLSRKNLPDAKLEHLEEVNNVLDVYHTFNNKYSYVGERHPEWGWQDMPSNQEYYRFVKESTDLKIPSFRTTGIGDFRAESRIDRLKTFCKEEPHNELSNHFYNEYYLKSDLVPEQVKDKCSEINKKFGVKVFLSSDHSQDWATLNYIEKEFAEWEKASEGQARKPAILDLSTIKRRYIDNEWVYGQSASAGCASRKEISINGSNFTSVSYALRHELTHINSLSKAANINKKYSLNEIMPKKEILNNKGKKISVPDFKNCKHKQEFFNAGLSKKHTEYAYNNPEEFIAVASEGDMSKYSPEFKQLLIDFGMPEWMFKMKSSDEVAHASLNMDFATF